MKFTGLMIVAILLQFSNVTSAFAEASCRDLFGSQEAIELSKKEIDKIILDIRDLKHKQLNSKGIESQIAAAEVKNKLRELRRVLSEPEILTRIRGIEAPVIAPQESARVQMQAQHNRLNKFIMLASEMGPLDQNGFNKDGYNLFHYLISKHRMEYLGELLESGHYNVNQETLTGKTPLQIAVEVKDEHITRYLLKHGATLKNFFKSKTENEITIDHLSPTKFDRISSMLIKGSDYDLRFDYYLPPVHEAVYTNLTEHLSLFIKIGADLNMLDQKRRTPIYLAFEARIDPKTLDMLMENGADINIKDHNGFTPLHTATAFENVRAIRKLVEAGADINAQNSNGQTPLHIASQNNKSKAVSALLHLGADPKIKDKRRKQALSLKYYLLQKILKKPEELE